MSETPTPQSNSLFSELLLGFLLTMRAEYGLSRETQAKYGECLKHVLRFVGDRPISDYGRDDLLAFRADLVNRNLSASRHMGLVLAWKRFLVYCREVHGAIGIVPESITPPKRPKREVVFLTPTEIDRFIGTIRLWTERGTAHISNLRFRALFELLLGSAMRISEALSLDRTSIDFVQREARVIGKGNKQRTVFLTKRSLYWVEEYLKVRTDDCPALFVCNHGRSRLKRDDIWRFFDRHRKLSGINKPVTPHILRHTAATLLLFNGCPMGHIKEILGHERLETTCRYYLGLDRTAAKAAHEKYLILQDAD